MSVKKKDRYAARHLWYFGEAQMLIRDLQAVMWPANWHVALGGGVLNHGYSNDDLDLYILPLNKRAKIEDATIALSTLLKYEQEISGNPRYKNMAPAVANADIYSHENRRVDVFIFAPHCNVCYVAERLLGEPT